ncbi:MAG: NYN domain-containing protein [Ignavibacteriales bacterium]|nr:NYN domain-containing protein [Ignavibacteriales bacterium]
MAIVYSDARPADLVIKDEIDRSKNPRNIIVVSSDHEVINYGKKSSCETMTSEDFIARFFSKGNEKEELEKINP